MSVVSRPPAKLGLLTIAYYLWYFWLQGVDLEKIGGLIRQHCPVQLIITEHALQQVGYDLADHDASPPCWSITPARHGPTNQPCLVLFKFFVSLTTNITWRAAMLKKTFGSYSRSSACDGYVIYWK